MLYAMFLFIIIIISSIEKQQYAIILSIGQEDIHTQTMK